MIHSVKSLRKQSKLPVCSTLAPPFSLFQGVAARHAELLGNRQDLQDFSGLIPIDKILKNPVNPVNFVLSGRRIAT
jgi:hypothetical protein